MLIKSFTIDFCNYVSSATFIENPVMTLQVLVNINGVTTLTH